jgi:Predicted signal-transduction protein containing cAMP-binding and CBS domains
MPITKFCVRDVVCSSRDTSIVDAAALMRHRHVGNVIVVDQIGVQRVPIGIVTDRDIVVEVVAAGLDPKLIKLGDLVLAPLTTIGEGAGYAETVRLMSVKGIRRMPVVDAAGGLIGIITLDDMLHQLAAPLAALSELAGRGRRYETLTRA